MKLLDKEFLEELEKKIYLSRVRISAVLIGFIFLSIFLFFGADFITRIFEMQIPFEVQFLQLYPHEVLYNNLKIGLFSSFFLCLPFLTYQMAKIFVDYNDINKKFKAITYSFWVFVLGLLSVLVSYFVFIPAQLYILYAINFDVSLYTMSLSAYTTFCIATIFSLFLFFLVFLVNYLGKNDLFFSFETLLKYKRTMLYISALIAILIVSPPEMFAFVFLFGFIYCLYIIVLISAKHHADKKLKEEQTKESK